MIVELNHHYNVDINKQDAAIVFRFSLIEDVRDCHFTILINWSGCANFGRDDGVLVHTCGRLMAEDIGKLIMWAYDYTKQNLEGFTE
jgi:hypothetical protein